MPALSEDLELNIGPALQEVDQLSSALDAAIQAVGPALADSISAALGSIDTSVLSGLTVPLTADGSELTAEGDTAVQAIDPTVILQADTTNLISGAEVAGATEGIDALTGATRGLDVANAGLQGSVSGVASAFGPYGAAIASVTAAGAVLFTQSVDEETALNRLKFVFGDLAGSIQQVNIPTLNFNLSLQQIATTTGASLPGLEQANSKLGTLGQTSGATGAAITATANQVTALATYLAVTNPALGSANDIMDRLTLALQRGGLSASRLGISLPTSELNAAAQATAGAGNQVTQFDKIAAGAAIVTDQLGASLGDAVTKGSDQAALALPKLKETLKETIAAVGAPLIGPVTQLFTDLTPVLTALATTIGHLLESATPLIGVLGLFLKVLGDLAGVINAIPLPVLTAAVEAFTAALVLGKVTTFAAGLFTLGANATADVGAVGLLTGAVDGLVAALGPVGVLVAAFGALWAITNASQALAASNAEKMALATAGLKSNSDVAKESATALQGQLDAVNKKITELKGQGQWFNPLTLPNFLDMQLGVGKTAAEVKALTAESKSLQSALDTAKSSTDALSTSDASASASAKAFGDAIAAQAAKLDGVSAAMASVESSNASLVSTAVGKLPGVAGVFGDVSSAIDAAAKAADKQASSSGSASTALADQASHAKELRDAMQALATAQQDFNTLAAGPTQAEIASGLLTIESAAKGTRDALRSVDDAAAALATLASGPSAEQLAAGYLTIEQAARSTQNAQQAVIDAQNALNLLTAGPSATTQAQAQENVAKADINRQKAVIALSDAIDAQTALVATGTATDRQQQDARLKVQEAQFALTDATTALNDAMAAETKLTTDSLPGSQALTDAKNKLTDAQLSLQAAQDSQQAAQTAQNKLIADSVPGSQALTDAQNKLSDAQLSLAQAQQTEAAAQDKQNKLFSDALPGSAAYTAALGKVSDAQDRLTQVQESGYAKSAASAAASAKTHVDALSALQTGLDQQIAAEDKFFADLEKIQAEGGTQIVAELLAQGPKQGAAEADAVAGATVTVVQALETKTETLKAKEDQHAQEIATIFGASLNKNLVTAFSTQLKNETDFYDHVTQIFNAGNTVLANSLRAQGPVQGGALAGAVADATPAVQAALEAQAVQLQTAESNFGKNVGQAFGAGVVQGTTLATASVTAAGGALGGALVAGTTTAIAAKSPSRVAMGLGQNWAEGLAQGIVGGIPLISDAATRLADALSPAVFTSLNDLLASSVAVASTAVAANLTAAAVAIPSQANASSTALAAVGAATPGVPGIVNNFNLPAGITDPQGIALAVSARQALQATR